MQELLTFDDVLIVPKFSELSSRAVVDLHGNFFEKEKIIESWHLPIISSNMDTVTGPEMASKMHSYGALACLPRFSSIEQNVEDFKKITSSWVSVGLGEFELLRATSLYSAGARKFILDVAHGAQKSVANRYVRLKRDFPDIFVVVGNFATFQSILDFEKYCEYPLDGVKIGIGPGSACTTRIKTGCGIPQLSAILDIALDFPGLIIADGGCKTPGDIAKALAAGAHLVMLGGMLAGTDETPGSVGPFGQDKNLLYKKYRGSASQESYAIQGKNQPYITSEGEAFSVPYKGSVTKILQDIEGGLRSALTYAGARNLEEFRQKTEFVKVTANTVRENGAHGKSI